MFDDEDIEELNKSEEEIIKDFIDNFVKCLEQPDKPADKYYKKWKPHQE